MIKPLFVERREGMSADLEEIVETYRILFIGDVVGKPGRRVLAKALPKLRSEHHPLFSIINGENSAAGVGITPDIAEEIFRLGADAITLGNHAYNKKEIFEYLDLDHPIVRPSNLPPEAPGRGKVVIEREGIALTVINLCGRVFLDGYDDPFREATRLIECAPSPHILVDFHAEATSEKIAMAYHLDGWATAVVGTHTHVTTADERVLPGGTAAITDVGMTGPMDSVIGMEKFIILHRFRTQMPTRFEVAEGKAVLNGVLIDVERESGRAKSITRLRYEEKD